MEKNNLGFSPILLSLFFYVNFCRIVFKIGVNEKNCKS